MSKVCCAGGSPGTSIGALADSTGSTTAVPLQAAEARKADTKKPVHTAPVHTAPTLKTKPEALLNWQKVTKTLSWLAQHHTQLLAELSVMRRFQESRPLNVRTC